jgi:hypothetical protein
VSNRLTEKQNMPKRIAELREELTHLIDYLDLLEARARNFGKRRYTTEQVRKMPDSKELRSQAVVSMAFPSGMQGWRARRSQT